jgi:hypothetical protein
MRDEIVDIKRAWKIGVLYTKFYSQNVKGKYHLHNSFVSGRVVLKWSMGV